jgi:uncharacterized protein (DUF58 family)
MTPRGGWTLFTVGLMLLIGLAQDVSPLAVAGLILLLWFGWEWLIFAVRVRTLRQRLMIERIVSDERGPVSTLWVGRFFTVRVLLSLHGEGRLPYIAIADPVPFGMHHDEGNTTADGELTGDSPLEIEYDVWCPLPGAARFEGLRVEITDLQGFFCHVTFLRDPVVMRIMPSSLVYKSGGPIVKQQNMLPPPGIHRLHRPGSGGELLDLRDYMPGDPPKTIAWKVSARRDRLVTKEFESEVPVRCTLFLDTSSSVRVPSPPNEADRRSAKKGRTPAYFKPLDRLVDLAAGVIRAGVSIRDLTGLCLFDEHSSRIVRPERTASHPNRLFQLLGEAATLAPVAERADPEELAPIAYAFAQEVYPDLLRREVNHMPWWLALVAAFPRFTRHRRGKLDWLYRRKATILIWCITILPFSLFVLCVLSLIFDWVPGWARGVLGGLLFLGTPLLVNVGWLLFIFSLLVSGKQRRRARWRKQLAALFAVRYGPIHGGIETLMQDDDLYALYLQRFLAEHHVPCYVPLYDEEGRYLFARPEKVGVLARAIVQAAARGRDNELYVLLVDLLELDGHLDPLLQAVRVALGRHHQVLVVCPWPQGVPLPEEAENDVRGLSSAAHQKQEDTVRGSIRGEHEAASGKNKSQGREDKARGLVRQLAFKQMHAAYGRIRRTFARLGVQMICAASEESVPLILNRLERIRQMGGRR